MTCFFRNNLPFYGVYRASWVLVTFAYPPQKMVQQEVHFTPNKNKSISCKHKSIHSRHSRVTADLTWILDPSGLTPENGQ